MTLRISSNYFYHSPSYFARVVLAIYIHIYISILNGTDPSHIRYLDSQSLRDHLIYCLETKTFTLFPSVDYDEDDDVVQSIVQTPVPKKAPQKKKVGKTTSKPIKLSEYYQL